MGVFLNNIWWCFISLLLVWHFQSRAENYSYLEDEDDDNGFTFLISGGHRVAEKQRLSRYMVSIRSRSPIKFFGDNHFCSGIIIGSDTVLTAAHCVMDKRKVLSRPRRLLVVAGSPNRLVSGNTTKQYPVKRLYAHMNYTLNNSNDIAIMFIKGTFPTDSENIAVMPLPKIAPVWGMVCTVIGWGRLYYKGPLAAATTHVDIELLSPEECGKTIPRFQSAGMICAGERDYYTEDPCRGDSGAPLVCDFALTGIVSWTIGCGSDLYPSLFADVFYHLDWIEMKIAADDCVIQPNVALYVIFVAYSIIRPSVFDGHISLF